MNEPLLSEYQALIGREGPATTTAVERGAVTRFAEAVGDPIVLGDDGEPSVPPTFLASLPYQRPRLPAGGDDHLINAENTFTFVRAPIVGEAITTTAAFTRVARRGPLVRLGLEVRYAGAGGAPIGAVTVLFVIDHDGVCAEGLGDAHRGRPAPALAEPPFVPHGVARPRSDPAAVRAWAAVDLASLGPNDALPPLAKAPLTTLQFVQYAGASGDFNPIHYDGRAASKAGLPDVVAPGLLKMAFFAQHMALCAGRTAHLRRLEARYVGFDVPGQELTSRAVVRGATVTGDGHRTLEIDLSLQDRHGEAATVGGATLEIPGDGEAGSARAPGAR